MTAMAAVTLGRLVPEAAEDRVAVLSVRWATADPQNDDVVARALLDAVFPEGPISDSTPFADLGSAARSAVHAVAERECASKTRTAILLGEYNFAASREALADWINETADPYHSNEKIIFVATQSISGVSA
jgi:hypothetical protein